MQKTDRKWWILAAMCLLTVMLNIDVTALNIAIPVITREFYADLSTMQWVINAYVLLSAMFQILGGRLGDSYGHRKIFLLGTALFVISSAGAGLSANQEMLIFFRTLQGLALGLAYPMTIVLTFAAFPKKQQAFALSFIIATMGMSLAIGPPLGGLFVDYFGWRWIFYINVPIGILTYFMAYVFCAPHKAEERHQLDYRGAFFLILGLFGMMVALNQVQNWGFGSIQFLSFFIMGFILLAVLYYVEKKHPYPLIDFNLFKIRNFLFNNIIRLISQLVFIPILFFIPLFLQNISGYSPIDTGIVMLFLTVVIGVLSPLAGKWVDHVGDKIPNIVSMVLFSAGCFLFCLLDQSSSIALLGSGLLLIGLATGISFVCATTGAVSVVSEKQQGMATGIIFTTAWFGCALGIAIMGAILSMTSHHYFMSHISVVGQSLSLHEQDIAERVAKGISSYQSLSEYFSGETLGRVTALSTESFIQGFRMSMITWMLLSIVGIVLSIYLKKHKGEHLHDIPPI